MGPYGDTWGRRPQRGQEQEQCLHRGSRGWMSHRWWLGSSGSVSPGASNICVCTSHACSSAPVPLTLGVPHSPGGLHKLRVSASCGGCCRQTCWLPASYLHLEIGFLDSPACFSNANVACDVHVFILQQKQNPALDKHSIALSTVSQQELLSCSLT